MKVVEMEKKGILLEINNEKYKAEYPKSKLTIAQMTIYFYKKFNWINRLMLRLIFGLKVENIKKKGK